MFECQFVCVFYSGDYVYVHSRDQESFSILCQTHVNAAASRPSWFQPRKRTVAAVLVAKRRRLDDVAATRRCVEEMALAARPDAPSGPSDRLSAAERMAQLRERVLARIETQPMAVPR